MEHLILSSDFSKKEYPDNTGGHFTNNLHGGNVNFSLDKSYVALSDISFTANSWPNVREGYNHIDIQMRDFDVWGMTAMKVYMTEKPEVERQDNKIRFKIRRKDGKKCNEIGFAVSEWYDIEGKWKDLGEDWMANSEKWPKEDLPAFKALIFYWDKTNSCNTQFSYMVRCPGAVPADWHKERVYVKPGYYDSYQSFCNAFNFAISDGIKNIFKKAHTHSGSYANKIRKIPKYSQKYYIGYQMTYYHRVRKLAKFHAALDAHDSDWADAFKEKTYRPATFGEDWINEFPNFAAHKTMVEELRVPYMYTNYFMDVIGEARKFIPLPTDREDADADDDEGFFLDTKYKWNNSWIMLGSYTILNSYVAGLTISKEFYEKTKCTIHINRHMQYQLGFTMNPLHDFGFITWYPRKEKVETTAVPSLYWYGYNIPNLNLNPMKTFYVHCDIIEGAYVGDKQLPILRAVPVNIFSHYVSVETFSSLIYRRINKNNISNISIWITETPEGNPITFRAPITVRLHFKFDNV